VIAVGVLAALVPVLVMSANHGWLNWSIAVTGVLLVLTALGALILVGGSPGHRRDGSRPAGD
jgi:VIT1/CCC1 family predicted Fe2+/Mn2+ transporter